MEIHGERNLNISEIIKNRLNEKKVRYFACDNIADYIDDKEREELISEISLKFNEVLKSLIIDIENDPNSRETGKRLAKMYVNEIMSGRFYPEPESTAFPNEGQNAYQGMLVVRAELKSVCSHHHQPVTGVAYIGVLPSKNVIGLSKYVRLAQHMARRGTLQEELCVAINETIRKTTGTEDVAVYIEADHGCCTNRGIMASSALTQTTVLNGRFHDFDVKKEFFDNISLQHKR